MRFSLPSSRLLLVVLALAFAGVGCPCVNQAVNSNEGLRWWLFSNFGASKICPEMTNRGMALKLRALGPESIGRYFPSQCRVQVDDANRTVSVTAEGTGYAFLPVARRVGFFVGVSVEYRPDFRLESDATYVWGRFSRLLAPPDVRLLAVENRVVDLATQTPLGGVANLLGQGVLTSELGLGFTVVRQDDGDDFTLGILTPPEKPVRPFKAGSGRTVMAADSTEVHAASRDYVGPFAVEASGAAVYFKYRVAGAPVTATLVPRYVGDAWRAPYQAGQPLGPPPSPPLATTMMGIGDGQAVMPVLPGQYYVVVENAAVPPAALGVPLPLPEASAHVAYSLEVGDRP